MDLPRRKQTLLRAVVDVYVRTAEPVGSQALVQSCQLGVKSATIRNELAEMTELGLLRQPHTSAGRVPSDQGYRFYVDRLLGSVPLGDEVWETTGSLRRHMHDELDEVLRQTCRLLSSLTQYASVASMPEPESYVPRQVHLTSLDPHHVLLVVIPPTGEVKHRILEVPGPVPPTRLTWLSKRITREASGLTVEQLRHHTVSAPDDLPEETAALYHQVWQALRDLIEPDAEAEVVVEGTTQILRQPEFRNLERLEAMLSALEERRELLRALRDSLAARTVTIRIGTENWQAGMQECSLVAARYSMGTGAYGSIGVVGPTRMDYRRAISAVEAMAQCLTELFGKAAYT